MLDDDVILSNGLTGITTAHLDQIVNMMKGLNDSSPHTLNHARLITDPLDWEIQRNGEVLLFDADAYIDWLERQIDISAAILDMDTGRAFAWRVHHAKTRLVMAGGDGIAGMEKTGFHSMRVWDDQGNHAWAFFTGDIPVPILWDNEDTWMSLTPMEIITCKPGIEAAHGHVLIGGLGLGWMASEILAKPEVETVTIIEIDPAVVDVFNCIPESSPHADKLVGTFRGDLWETLRCHQESCAAGIETPYDSFILDIWPGYGDASDDPQLADFKAWAEGRGNTVWAWGDRPAWVRERSIQGKAPLKWIEHPSVPAVFQDGARGEKFPVHP